MATQIDVIRYDMQTKQYTAQLSVTRLVTEQVTDEVTKESREVITEVLDGTYTCEGTWHDEDAPMAAGALFDQHKAALAKVSSVAAEKQAIADKIAAAVSKLAAAEVK